MSKKNKIKARRKAAGPIVTSSKIKETISRIQFEEIFSNWLVTRWIEHDYGIDAMVEITHPLIGSDDRIPTGKKFSVQIKARGDKPDKNNNYGIKIQVGKVRYWLNCTEAVMLCRYDVNTKKLYYIWIDESLVSKLTKKKPKWLSQKSITLHIKTEEELTIEKLEEIGEYVIRWKQAVRKPLKPGEFFELKNTALELYENITANISTIESESLSRNINELKERIDRATYTVAITGPSRAGKSTLLNAIVRHEISPVDILPTTGLPVAVVGGDKNESEIIFNDGRIIRQKATSKSLKPYVCQNDNPDNEKNVKLITVKLVNDQLERGISFLDVPGLDDPSPEIQSITIAALNLTNAVIYVVDASTMATGGFSIRKYHIDDLRKIGSRADRLFFVLNKVDGLSKNQKDSLLTYVNKTFEKYGLTDILPVDPILISAQNAWEKRKSDMNSIDDSVSKLENALWNFLISNNRIGLYRLYLACFDLKRSIEEAQTIMNAKLIDSDKATTFKANMITAEKQIPKIRLKIQNNRESIRLRLLTQISMRKDAIINHLKNELRTIPLEQQLPSNKVLRSFLEQQAQMAATEIFQELKNELGKLSFQLNQWIEETLSQVKGTFSEMASKPEKELSIREFHAPIPEDLSAPAIGAISLGLLGLIFGPAGALFGAIIGWLGGLFASAPQRRDRRINEIIRRSKSAYERIFREIETETTRQLNNKAIEMENWTIDRATLFLSDIKTQLDLLGEELSESKRRNIKTLLTNLSDEIPKIDRLIKTLKSYSY